MLVSHTANTILSPSYIPGLGEEIYDTTSGLVYRGNGYTPISGLTPISGGSGSGSAYTPAFPPIASSFGSVNINGSYPTPGRPGQYIWDERTNSISEWRPLGLTWNADGAYLRCDLAAPIAATDYEVTVNCALVYPTGITDALTIQLGPTFEASAEGGYHRGRGNGTWDGAVFCGGAAAASEPTAIRYIRFGRWNNLCHSQGAGGEVTSATNNASWNGQGPIYVGGFPAKSSIGPNSVIYSVEIKLRSTGVLLASFDPADLNLSITNGKTWVDKQGNTWTQVGTPVQSITAASWVKVWTAGPAAYNNGAALATLTDPNQPWSVPDAGTLAWLNSISGLGNMGGLVAWNSDRWTPVGVPTFSTVAQRDSHWTAGNLGVINEGSMCVTIDGDILWAYQNGAWVPIAGNVPWIGVTFQNAWIQAAGLQAVQYRKVGDTVQMRGVASTGATGTVMFTLPAGFRPLAVNDLPAVANSVFGHTVVNIDGTVVANGAPNYNISGSFSLL